MRGKEVDGVVVAVCDEPSFVCLEILESSGFCYAPQQLEIATFSRSHGLRGNADNDSNSQ